MGLSLISPKGEKIQTRTAKEMAEITGLDRGNIRSLKAGCKISLHGYFSTHPRARARRKRYFTEIVHLASGRKRMIRNSARQIAREEGLSWQALGELLRGEVVCYRGWVLKSTYEMAYR